MVVIKAVILLTLLTIKIKCCPPSPTTPSPSPNCNCGIAPNKQKTNNLRIVGGMETKPNKYPWQVGLIKPGFPVFCGGSIISAKHVLTAAHCFFIDDVLILPEFINVLVGLHHLVDWQNEDHLHGLHVRLNVSRILNHPNYINDVPNYGI